MKYRSKTDIIVSMLEAARHGGRKSKIMYWSYLTSHQLRTYLEIVIGNGLLEYDSTKERYSTTERGLRLGSVRQYERAGISSLYQDPNSKVGKTTYYRNES
jgi:predicted transcriptional regulator